MEKAPIKKFAVEARRKLIADVTFQLERYGITEKGIVEPQTSTDKELVFDLGNGNVQTIRGVRAVNQYKNLAAHVRGFYTADEPKKELEQFIEEIAYTWFNRLIAIRFMEVNRYLPVRVLSSEITGQKLPDLVKAPFSGDLEFTEDEKQRIFDLQDANKEDDLFRFLFFKQCNDLSRILPRLFEDLDGSNSFSELLITLSFNDPNGVVYRLVNEVDERWFDIHATDEEGKPIGQVQIIGWMYQYYNTEPKDKVFADLKKNVKISKQNIPAATQLFTPDWIVRYMVENSLGRLWYEGHPDFDKSKWKYYLDEAPQEPQVEQQLQEIRAQYAKMEPEQLKVIDPCMGSGHILCYLFDVLMQIYLDNGYSKREAVRSILENNLFGLDIDKRAAQIAYFSVMMKAREYDSNFFSRSNIPQPRVYDIQESNWLGGAYKHEMGNFLNSQQHRDTLNYLLDAFVDAKEYGSILQIKPLDYEGLKEAWETSAAATAHDVNMAMWYDAAKDAVAHLIEQAVMLSQKYDAVVTNPPYINSSGMNGKLLDYVKEKYVDTKADMSFCFMQIAFSMTKKIGKIAMINIPVWMNIASCKNFRKNLIESHTMQNLLHCGRGIFGSDFGSCAFCFESIKVSRYNSFVCKLFDQQGNVDTLDQKEKFFLQKRWIYQCKMDDFLKLPNYIITYKLSRKSFKLLSESDSIGKYATARQGMATADNNRFLRFWHEISEKYFTRCVKAITGTTQSNEKWVPYSKGGEYRKWYGNNEYVVNWQYNGAEIRHFKKSVVRNPDYFFRRGLTWTALTAGNFSMRYLPEGFSFDSMGPVCFVYDEKDIWYVLAILNSCIGKLFLNVLCPNFKFDQKPLENVPVAFDEKRKGTVSELSKNNVNISKRDWDSFETSWDFKKHPLV